MSVTTGKQEMPTDRRYRQIWWQKARQTIMTRDRECFANRYDREHPAHYLTCTNPMHVCRDQWGNEHSPFDWDRLTLDHVHTEPGGVRGKKAPDRLQNMTAMCGETNVKGPCRHIRAEQRAYLKGIYGEEEGSGG